MLIIGHGHNYKIISPKIFIRMIMRARCSANDVLFIEWDFANATLFAATICASYAWFSDYIGLKGPNRFSDNERQRWFYIL